jgi:RNA polymerase sigma-70 factor (ECF subfamily)
VGPLRGRKRVAHTLLAWASRGFRAAGLALREVEVNGQPGALVLDGDGKLISVVALEIADGQVQAMTSIVNPDKLRHIGPVGDLRALLRVPRS